MQKKLKKIALFLFSQIIIFCIFEVLFRWYAANHQLYDIEMHKYARFLNKESKLEGLTHEHIPNSSAELMGVNISLNNLGFRNKENFVLDSSRERILVIGSSIALGWGVDYEDTFTALLEKDLNDKLGEKKIQVLNAGVGNFNTQFEATLFDHYKDSVRPNSVVLHYFLRDAEIISQKKSNFFIKNSYLIAYFYVRVKHSLLAKKRGYKSLTEYYTDLYRDNAEGWINSRKMVLKIRDICKERNINFLVAVQPELHDLSTTSKLNFCYSTIENFFDENDIQYVDLTPLYRQQYIDSPEKLWVAKDDSHPNSIGHKIIFKGLSDYFNEYYSNCSKD